MMKEYQNKAYQTLIITKRHTNLDSKTTHNKEHGISAQHNKQHSTKPHLTSP